MEPFYVLYDGDCGLCRRTTERLRRADFFRRLTFVNARDRGALKKEGLERFQEKDLAADLHAVSDEKIWRGFEAYRAIAARLPLLWPAWPFLWVWPVSALGRRAYRHVADTRSFRPSGKACAQNATSCAGKETKEPRAE